MAAEGSGSGVEGDKPDEPVKVNWIPYDVADEPDMIQGKDGQWYGAPQEETESETTETGPEGDLDPGEDPNLSLEEIYKKGWQATLPYESGFADPKPLVYGQTAKERGLEDGK